MGIIQADSWQKKCHNAGVNSCFTGKNSERRRPSREQDQRD
jgi:hypothetical protein